MAKTAAQLMVEFGSKGSDQVIADTKKVGGAVDDAGKKAGWFGTALGTAIGFGAVGLATKLGSVFAGIGKSMISAAGDAEQMKMSLETAVGPRTEQVFKNLQKFAADTPFEFPELLQSTINLENFGIKADQVIGQTGRTWTQVIGDTASAMGKTYDQVTQAVLDASTGEYERLKELGVKATVEGDKVRFAYMKNGKQMVAEADRNNSEMIQSTLAAIWNDKYQGAMEKQSRSFNGMLSTFRDNVNLTMQRASGSVFGFAKDGLKHANLFFDRLNVGLDRGMGLFDATMRATKFTLQDVFGKTAGNIIFAGIDNMVSSIERGARVAKGFASGIFNVGAALGAAFFGADRKSFIQNLPSWARSTAQGLSTIAEAGGDLFRAFQSGGFTGFWDALTTGGEGQQIVNAIQRMLDTAIDNAGNFTTKAFRFVVNAAPELASDVWGGLGDAWSWLQAKIGVRGAGTVGDGTGGPETDTKPISLGDVAFSFAGKIADTAWDGATDFTGWAAKKIKAGGLAVIDLAQDGAQLAIKFAPKIGDVWGDAKDATGWLRNQISDKGEIAIDNITGVINGEIKLSDTFQGLINGLGDFIEGLVNGGGGGGYQRPGFGMAGSTADIGRVGNETVFSNWTLKVGPPDGGVTIDLAGIAGKVWGFLTDKHLFDVSDETVTNFETKGQEWGKEIGDKLVKGISNFFGGGGGGGEGGATAADQQTVSDAVGAFVRGLFSGLGDVIGAEIGKAWTAAADDITGAMPAWAKLLIGGDYLGAFKSLLGIGGSGNSGLPSTQNVFGGGTNPTGLFNPNGDQIFTPNTIYDPLSQPMVPQQLPAGQQPVTVGGNGPGGHSGAAPASAQPGTLGNGTVVTTLPNVGTGSAAPGSQPTKIPPPDISLFSSVMQSIPKIVGQNMSDALSAATTYATATGTVVGSIFGSLVGNVGALMGQLTVNVGQGMSDSLAAATTYSNAIYVGVSTNIGQMVGNVSVMVGTIPGIVTGAMNQAASDGAAAAYNAGLSIGAGLANGMDAMIGQVQAKANELANAATSAARAALIVQSPSKVFFGIGQHVGEGFALGMQDRYGAARLAAFGLAGAAMSGASGPVPANRLPVRATMPNRGGATIQVFGVKSREYAELLRKAELGELVAYGLAPELELVIAGATR